MADQGPSIIPPFTKPVWPIRDQALLRSDESLQQPYLPHGNGDLKHARKRPTSSYLFSFLCSHSNLAPMPVMSRLWWSERRVTHSSSCNSVALRSMPSSFTRLGTGTDVISVPSVMRVLVFLFLFLWVDAKLDMRTPAKELRRNASCASAAVHGPVGRDVQVCCCAAALTPSRVQPHRLCSSHIYLTATATTYFH